MQVGGVQGNQVLRRGQDVSEYLDNLGLVKSYFFKFFEKKNWKKIEKKMPWCSDAPEDEAISLFAGLLANPGVPLSLEVLLCDGHL